MSDDSQVVETKLPCESCSSSDAVALYDDGHRFCFSCGTYFPADKPAAPASTKGKKMSKDLIAIGDARALSKRGITAETCAKWKYHVGEFSGKPVQIANYVVENKVVAQKVRFPNKDFLFLGDTKHAGLYGQHLWRDSGKMVVITEGEIDALSVSQAQGNKWPVVSVPNGAQGAAKAVVMASEWLEKFESVIFMFDMDEPGQKAARECALLLSPGKAKIASLPVKDANAMLQAGRTKEIIDAIWGAKSYRPDGVVKLDDVREKVLMQPEVGLPWCLPMLTQITYGRRLGEVYCFGAGTGVGKTDLLTQQVVHDLTELHEKVAVFFLEQQPDETAKRIAGKLAGKRFHVPDDGWTQDELVTALDTLQKDDGLFMYDHFGSAEWETIRATIRYLARAEGVRLFYLDHLTALAAEEEDERKALEKIMAQIGSLVKELNVSLTMVSHLATPEGKPHEEGGRVTIRHFKGSRSIGFWSHFMFGLERNQQSENEVERHTTTFRVLKDRYTGQSTGRMFYLGYDPATGRLFETEQCPFDTHNEPSTPNKDF